MVDIAVERNHGPEGNAAQAPHNNFFFLRAFQMRAAIYGYPTIRAPPKSPGPGENTPDPSPLPRRVWW